MRTDDEQKGLEGNMRGMRYQAGVTEHKVGAGRQAGGGTLGATEGEYGCGFSTRDKADAGNVHPSWRRIQRLANRDGD